MVVLLYFGEVYFVYILYSSSLCQHYIGQSVNSAKRAQQHNEHFYSNSFTSKAKDWQLIFELACESKKQALSIEKHIKKMKSTAYIQNLIKYPEMSIKLLQRFQ